MGGDIMALVGWWPLDGNTNDYSVNNNTGVNNNVTFVNGKIGQAGSFNGTATSFVGLPASNSFKPQLPISISLWYKPNILNVEQMLFQNDDYNCSGWASPSSGSNLYHGIAIIIGSSNSISASYGNGGSCASSSRRSAGSASGVINNTNFWYHITVVIKGPTNFEIYLNGTSLPLTYSGTGNSLTYSSSNGRIGGASNGGLPSNSLINDIRLYDHILSQKEINELAKAKVLHYVFNKDESIVYDGSGYKRDGNKVNSPTFVEGRLGSGSYRFADISKYIQSPYGLGINPFINGYTFSMWIKITSTQDQMFFHTPNGSSQRFYIAVYLGKWDMGIQGVPWGTGVTTAVNNQWSHIVVTMSGGFAKMYVNGIYSFQKTYTSYTFPDNLRIGSRSDYITSDSLDDVRIYATALSDADILDLYQTRAKIDNQGNLYANEFVEDYEITNNITLLSQYDKETNRVTHSSFLARSGALLEKFDNYARVLAQNQFSFISQTLSLTAGKKYYIAGSLKTTSSLVRLISFNGQSDTTAIPQKLGEYTLVSNYITCQNSITNNIYINQFRDNRSSGFDYFFVRDTVFIEVTDIFGAGSEPTKEQLDAWYRDYSQSRTKSNGQIITSEFNEVGIDTTAFESKNLLSLEYIDSNLSSTNHSIVEDGRYINFPTFPNVQRINLAGLARENTQYTLTMNIETDQTLVVQLSHTDGTFVQVVKQSGIFTFTSSAGKTVSFLRFFYASTSPTYMKIYENGTQLEEGSLATDYVPYKKLTYREIFVTNNEYIRFGTTETFNGITKTLQSDDSWILNGTATSTSERPLSEFFGTTGSYYFNGMGSNDNNSSTRIIIWNNNSITLFQQISNGESAIKAFDQSTQNNLRIWYNVLSGNTITNMLIKPVAINLTTTFSIVPTQAQMDLLYAQYRQLKTEEQALRIFKNKIHIQGSLNEGGQ
jgi:hypothetical protein